MTTLPPSRRDVLATFLGASVAAAGCRRGSPTVSSLGFPGDLLGPDHVRGHRLRDPAVIAEAIRVARASMAAAPRVRVAIVGGGPAGVSAAWRLLRAGLTVDEFVILEHEAEAGGTSRGGESSVTRYPWGAHYVPVPSSDARALIALLDEMGIVERYDVNGAPVVAEHVVCRAPEERLFYRGTWYEGLYLSAGARATDLAQWRAFRREVQRWGKRRDAEGRRMFAIPTARASACGDVLALDDLSMRQWLHDKGWRSPRLHWLVDYACRDDYGLSIDEASAWGGLFYFASRMGADGHPAPLMTWPEGNGALVRHMLTKVGKALRTGASVVDVSVAATPGGSADPTGLAPALVTFIDTAGTPKAIVAERVIVALPRYVARRVIAPLRALLASDVARQADEARAFDYGAWVVANVHVSERPDCNGVPFAWDNVLYESPSLGYVVSTHQAGVDHGASVWSWYYALTGPGEAARKRLLTGSWREWSEVALADLQRAHPTIGSSITRMDIWRWGHAMVRPHVGARRALGRSAPARPSGQIHFAHTDLSGVALFEEAHDNGVRAAEEVLVALNLTSPSIR